SGSFPLDSQVTDGSGRPSLAIVTAQPFDGGADQPFGSWRSVEGQRAGDVLEAGLTGPQLERPVLGVREHPGRVTEELPRPDPVGHRRGAPPRGRGTVGGR